MFGSAYIKSSSLFQKLVLDCHGMPWAFFSVSCCCIQAGDDPDAQSGPGSLNQLARIRHEDSSVRSITSEQKS